MAVFAPDFAYWGTSLTDFNNPRGPLLSGAWDVESFVVDGDIWAYVTAASDRGIQLVNLSNREPLDPFEFAITDAEVGGLRSPRDLEMVDLGTSTFLITVSHHSDGNSAPGTISVYLMDETPGDTFGHLTQTDSLTEANALHGVTDFTLARVGLKTFIVSAATFTDTISVVSVGSDGTLGRIRTVTEQGNPALPLDGVVDVAYARAGSDSYILSAANGFEGLGLWRLSGNGTLTLVDTARPNEDQGNAALGFQTAGLHVAQINKLGALAFAYDVTTRSVVSYLIAGGELQYRGATSMGNAYINEAMVEMKTLTYMGEMFLVTSDAGNNTVSLFHVGDDGTVSHVRGFSNGLAAQVGPGTTYLQQSQGLDIVERDGRLWVVAASASGTLSGGVTLVEIGGGPTGSFTGDDADDLFFSFARDVTARGNGGDDLFRAGVGHMNAYGGTGNDDWRGNDEAEFAFGGSGNDTLTGGDGDDTIKGGADAGEETDPDEGDADMLYGGKGRDVIRAGNADDSVYGGDNGDTIYGDFGNDLIQAGKGNDLIYGGVGDDTINGGDGADDFVIFTNTGPNHDRIDGFEIGQDQIKFRGPHLDSFAEVHAAMTQDGQNVVITVTASCSVTLSNILLDDLTAANFLFD